MQEEVILVDRSDKPIGTMEKIEAHQKGALHRAFSIFVFNSNDELLIHQRAQGKYHSNSLWTNTCCSHPRPGEDVHDAVHRRLLEEMGFDCQLKRAFSFIYESEMDNDLIEFEFDHVFIGQYNGDIYPNPNEVQDYKFMKIRDIKADIAVNPEHYTVWFRKVIDRVEEYFLLNSNFPTRIKVA